jgi:beta-1,4-mannosyl-glycoprotein beta-1,4-N-acetylglucosaminyltransferase
MVVDVITYNGEAELFDLRYNILKDYVDEFVVVEFDKTFSGKDKPFYFESVKDKYEGYRYVQVKNEVYDKYIGLAESSPNTVGAEHWKREFCQKEYIKDCIKYLEDDDIVFIGDCDEIWDPEKALQWCHAPFKYKLRVYAYYLNNHSSEEFWGTLVSPYRDIKNACLNHLRTTAWKTVFYAGWHFTSLKDALRRKLEDSYTKETYANDWVMQHLEENVNNNKDFLGRDFTYTIDESEWPQYLKDNREKYARLCK